MPKQKVANLTVVEPDDATDKRSASVKTIWRKSDGAPVNVQILVCNKFDGTIWIDQKVRFTATNEVRWVNSHPGTKITHWMPMPKPPTKAV